MENNKIAIIGGGNMGRALAGGLLSSGFVSPNELVITKRDVSTMSDLAEKGVTVIANNRNAAKGAQFIVLALKPGVIRHVLKELTPILNPMNQNLISIAAGILFEDMGEILGEDYPLIRAMPNMAMSVNASITCISQKNVRPERMGEVQALFNAVGSSVVIEEKLMDAATVLGGSEIAYALRFVRANVLAGIEIGFEEETATKIVAQALKGAAEILLQTSGHPEEGIDHVSTPRGCTITGLNEMEHYGFSSAIIRGILTAYNKIERMK